METLFETHPAIFWQSGKIDVVQYKAKVESEKVLHCDSIADGGGTSIYGSVLHDGGVYRMWYQATPKDWDDANMTFVAYAESDDGLEWRKPELGLVDLGGSKANNLTNLGVHCPSVWIDPAAADSHRYRATGCLDPDVRGIHPGAEKAGYFTFHSSDGLNWNLDTTSPQWDAVDVITSIYHPQQRRGIVAMKFNPNLRGFMRRVIYNAEFKDGEWSKALPALIPDEFDDIGAVARGFATGDYYGTAMLPAGKGTVAMIWQFRHRLPRSSPLASSLYGVVDISLAYQRERGACWEHQAGRPDFVSCADHDWTRGGLYSASSPVEVGDEHFLYITGAGFEHAYGIDEKGQTVPELVKKRHGLGDYGVGIARFPKYRLFGFRAHPTGILCLKPEIPDGPWEMHLNYACTHGGHINVSLNDAVSGERLGTAAVLEGDATGALLEWDEDARKHIGKVPEVTVMLNMEHATVYAYEVKQVG
jgi:hypothetical protein